MKKSYSTLLGEYLGTLQGILLWKIPKELRLKLENILKDLEKVKKEHFK